MNTATLTIGRRLIPSEHVALVEPFEPSPNGQFQTAREFFARVVLLNRESVLIEQTPQAFAFNNERLAVALEKTGRDVSMFVLVMLIMAETDEEAEAKWKSYNDGVDVDAISWLATQGAADKNNATTNVRQLAAPEGAVNINMGTLVGSYAKVAAMLDDLRS